MQFPNASLVFYDGLVHGALCTCAGSLRGQVLGSSSGPQRGECTVWSSPAEPSVSQRRRESKEAIPDFTAQCASVLQEAFLPGDETIFMHVKLSRKKIAVIESVSQILKH